MIYIFFNISQRRIQTIKWQALSSREPESDQCVMCQRYSKNLHHTYCKRFIYLSMGKLPIIQMQNFSGSGALSFCMHRHIISNRSLDHKVLNIILYLSVNTSISYSSHSHSPLSGRNTWIELASAPERSSLVIFHSRLPLAN